MVNLAPVIAYIALGANLGDRPSQLNQAIDLMNKTEGLHVQQVSTFLETKPVGLEEQPDFINAVARVETTLEPADLLKALLSIEVSMGRKRLMRWGPRLIDLDILLYADRQVDEPWLHIPHKELKHRDFWIQGLKELGVSI